MKWVMLNITFSTIPYHRRLDVGQIQVLSDVQLPSVMWSRLEVRKIQL